MTNRDYFPKKEGEVVPWIENFVQVATANAAALGLGTVDITALKTMNGDLAGKINAAIAKQSEAKAATEAKNIQMDKTVDTVRSMVRQVQAKPGVPDNLKAQLRITIPSPSPTPSVLYPPKDLSAEMTSGGLCLMKWNRNSNNYGTTFIIEASNKTTEKWEMIGTTTKSQYEAKMPDTLGNNLFRVKAQKGTNISEASNVILI